MTFCAICNASNLSSKTFLIFLKPSFTWAKFALTLKLSACNLSATWSGILWINWSASSWAEDTPSFLPLPAIDPLVLNEFLGPGLIFMFNKPWVMSLFFNILSLSSSDSSSSSSSASSDVSLLWNWLNLSIFNFSLAWFNSFCICSLLKACFLLNSNIPLFWDLILFIACSNVAGRLSLFLLFVGKGSLFAILSLFGGGLTLRTLPSIISRILLLSALFFSSISFIFCSNICTFKISGLKYLFVWPLGTVSVLLYSFGLNGIVIPFVINGSDNVGTWRPIEYWVFGTGLLNNVWFPL